MNQKELDIEKSPEFEKVLEINGIVNLKKRPLCFKKSKVFLIRFLLRKDWMELTPLI